MPFVHLRTHTEFSVVDGTLRVDDAAAEAAKDGQVALAVTLLWAGACLYLAMMRVEKRERGLALSAVTN